MSDEHPKVRKFNWPHNEIRPCQRISGKLEKGNGQAKKTSAGRKSLLRYDQEHGGKGEWLKQKGHNKEKK